MERVSLSSSCSPPPLVWAGAGSGVASASAPSSGGASSTVTVGAGESASSGPIQRRTTVGVRVGLHGREGQRGPGLGVLGDLERHAELLELAWADAPAGPRHGVDPLGDLLALVVDRLVELGHLHRPLPALDRLEARRDHLLWEFHDDFRRVSRLVLVRHAHIELGESARLPLGGVQGDVGGRDGRATSSAASAAAIGAPRIFMFRTPLRSVRKWSL